MDHSYAPITSHPRWYVDSYILCDQMSSPAEKAIFCHTRDGISPVGSKVPASSRVRPGQVFVSFPFIENENEETEFKISYEARYDF